MENNRENAVQSGENEENEVNPKVLDLQIIEDLAGMCERMRITFLEFENEDFKLTLCKNQSDESITKNELSEGVKHAKQDAINSEISK